MIAEVLPGTMDEDLPSAGHAAYSVAPWLRRADLNGSLSHLPNPALLRGRAQDCGYRTLDSRRRVAQTHPLDGVGGCRGSWLMR